MLMLSSFARSLEDRFALLSLDGIGGGDELFPPGGVMDLLEVFEFRDGVLYGVSWGVGSDPAAGPLYSSSVSHMTIVNPGPCQAQVEPQRSWSTAK
jgi:hypothetical protein